MSWSSRLPAITLRAAFVVAVTVAVVGVTLAAACTAEARRRPPDKLDLGND